MPHDPEVPTLKETDFDVEVQHWFGLVAPAGIPPDAARKLEAALTEALTDQAVKAKLSELGLVLTALDAPKFRDFIRAETSKWSKLIKENGLKLDQPRQGPDSIRSTL